MATDRFDKSRNQYIDYKLYLERRRGNHYYNLGYASYDAMVKNPPSDLDNIEDAFKNFEIALLFNSHDVDAKKRQDEMCDKWGEVPGFTKAQITDWKAEAKQQYKCLIC